MMFKEGQRVKLVGEKLKSLEGLEGVIKEVGASAGNNLCLTVILDNYKHIGMRIDSSYVIPYMTYSFDNSLNEGYTESPCPIVQRVVNMFHQRAEVGFKKYGVTADRDDLSLIGWATHLQEELMDATIYIEKLKKQLNSLEGIVDGIK